MSLSTIRKMTLRLNMEEPKQAEIYQILTSLDKYIYKSQNQFLVDALEFYIEHSGSGKEYGLDRRKIVSDGL